MAKKVLVIGNSERIVHFYGKVVGPLAAVEFDDPKGEVAKSAEQEEFLDVLTEKEATEKKTESNANAPGTTDAGWIAPGSK